MRIFNKEINIFSSVLAIGVLSGIALGSVSIFLTLTKSTDGNQTLSVSKVDNNLEHTNQELAEYGFANYFKLNDKSKPIILEPTDTNKLSTDLETRVYADSASENRKNLSSRPLVSIVPNDILKIENNVENILKEATKLIFNEEILINQETTNENLLSEEANTEADELFQIREKVIKNKSSIIYVVSVLDKYFQIIFSNHDVFIRKLTDNSSTAFDELTNKDFSKLTESIVEETKELKGNELKEEAVNFELDNTNYLNHKVFLFKKSLLSDVKLTNFDFAFVVDKINMSLSVAIKKETGVTSEILRSTSIFDEDNKPKIKAIYIFS